MNLLLKVHRENEATGEIPLGSKNVLLGRASHADIFLHNKQALESQALISVKNGAVVIENHGAPQDLKVNGRPVNSTVISDKDEIDLLDYSLILKDLGNMGPLAEGEAKNYLHQELIDKLDLRKLKLEELKGDDLRDRCSTIIDQLLDDIHTNNDVDKSKIKREVLNEALGLGPLEELLYDEDITEIMVNSRDKIFVEKKGKLTLTPLSFSSDEKVLNVIARIIEPIGRRIDDSMPLVDARLADGSRVNAIIPPLSLKGPMITIRKFGKTNFTVTDYVNFGSTTAEMMDFLEICVQIRKNTVISGGTGSGKTSLLNCLSSFIPSTERVLTIEDSAELKLPHQNIGSLEARPPNLEGKGAITIRDLVKNALRMRPDRIVVGECRGGESLDMLQAMNTGHDGSLTTLHANSANDAVLRLETMVMMAGFELPSIVIRQQIAAAVNIIVQQTRLSDGSRKIVAVYETLGMDGHDVKMQEIFRFQRKGIDKDGKVQGEYIASGNLPSFYDEIAQMGHQFDKEVFTKDRLLK